MKRSILSALLLLLGYCANAQLKGKVVSVSDGDTFTLLTEKKEQIRIRLYGIDCPEKGQDFGTVAKNFTSELVFGRFVEVEQKDVDRYGRTVGIVYVDGKCLNEELLKAGLAWHYVYYDKSVSWQKLEDVARKAKAGLWSATFQYPPWEWRRMR